MGFYLIGINAVALLAMAIDKVKAVRSTYRIPERFFVMMTVVGGGLGVVAGMLAFKHKIRKPLFTFWIPLIGALVYGLGFYGWTQLM